LNEEYTTFIAREWNTSDAASGYVGYVLRFSVRTDFISQSYVQTVGSATARQYWIPADELDAFNQQIVGPIEIIAKYSSAS